MLVSRLQCAEFGEPGESCYDAGRGVLDSTKQLAHRSVNRSETLALLLHFGRSGVKQYE